MMVDQCSMHPKGDRAGRETDMKARKCQKDRHVAFSEVFSCETWTWTCGRFLLARMTRNFHK